MGDINEVMDDKEPGFLRMFLRNSLLMTRKEVDTFMAALRERSLGSWAWAFLLRQYWLWAIGGSLVLGLTLPVLLVVWNGQGQVDLLPMNGPTWQSKVTAQQMIEGAILLLAAAMIFCGPIAAVLALVVYAALRKHADVATASLHLIAKRGAIIAGLMAFLNVFGYLAVGFLPMDHPVPVWVRLPLLFIVAGVSCGMWIAWQAWRATRPTEPVLPRYSLSWLLMLVIGWGAVMAVYAPK